MTYDLPPSPERQRFDVGVVNAMRQAAASAAELEWESEDGWSLSPIRPAGIIEAIPALRVLPGLDLQGYEYRSGGNGNGVVWAVPAGTASADIDPGPFFDYPFSPPPQPAGARPAMSAVTGDLSAWSYLCASIAARELLEFGARWHGCSWTAEVILGAAPWEQDPDPDRGYDQPEEEWAVESPLPDDWSPSVQVQDDQIVVCMYTYSALGGQVIIRNVDTYAPGNYEPSMEFTELARAPGGFVY